MYTVKHATCHDKTDKKYQSCNCYLACIPSSLSNMLNDFRVSSNNFDNRRSAAVGPAGLTVSVLDVTVLESSAAPSLSMEDDLQQIVIHNIMADSGMFSSDRSHQLHLQWQARRRQTVNDSYCGKNLLLDHQRKLYTIKVRWQVKKGR